MELLARAAKIGFFTEVGDVHHQRITFPARDGIAPVLMNILRQMRPIADRNYAIESGALTDVVVDINRIGALDDAHHAAEISERSSVRRQLSRWENHGKAVQQTTFDAAAVLGTIRAVHAIDVVAWRGLAPQRGDRSGSAAGGALQERREVLAILVDSLLRLRSKCWHSPVGRVNDHGCAAAYFRGLVTKPMLVICASDDFFRAADVLPVDFPTVPAGQLIPSKEIVLSFLVFGVGHEFPIAKFLAPLERDHGRVAPCAL